MNWYIKFLNKNQEYLYLAFRLIIGIMFFLHGIMKFPDILSGATPFFSQIWFAGMIETISGALFIIGLYTSYAAFFTGGEMLVAFIQVHVGMSGTLNPILNKGEPAVLFFAAFIIFLIKGSGRYSLDHLLQKRR